MKRAFLSRAYKTSKQRATHTKISRTSTFPSRQKLHFSRHYYKETRKTKSEEERTRSLLLLFFDKKREIRKQQTL